MSVYKRGEVYWFEFVFQGRRYRDTTGLSNKNAALNVEAIRRAELAEGRAGIVKREPCPTFEDFMETVFLPWSKREHAAHPRTHMRYLVSAKPLRAFFGKMPLDTITSGHVERYKLDRSGHVGPAGTNRDMANLRSILNLAIRQERISRNPVIGVRFLQEGPGCMRAVSHEEQMRYLAAATQPLEDVAKLIVETGMCPEEVFSIRKEDVHLSVSGGSYLFVPFGKTKFRRRNVPLTAEALAILRRRKAEAEGPFVFPRKHDSSKPLTTVYKAHLEALETTKIKPPFRLYDLRHTFGSRMAMAGVELATLRELMGHSNISTTMRYVHPTPEHKRAAVEKLERYNVQQVFAIYEGQGTQGSPQKSPQ